MDLYFLVSNILKEYCKEVEEEETDGQEERHKMVGLHHAHPEHFVAELGEEDQADDAELAGVREDDVGSVGHDRHGRAGVALSDQTVEPLRNVLRRHQSSELLQIPTQLVLACDII